MLYQKFIQVSLFFFLFHAFMLIYLCDLSGLSQVFLKGLPISVTSGDVRRAIKLAGLVGVTDGELARIPNHFSD